MSRHTVGCPDFPAAEGCCPTCHVDEGYGYQLLEHYADEAGSRHDNYAIVCCAVSNSVDWTSRKVWADAFRVSHTRFLEMLA